MKKKSLNQRRVFSTEIKKQTVKDIEKGKCSVAEAARELQVNTASIYKWLNKYSLYLTTNKKIVVENKSEAYKSKELEKKIIDLEAALGRKQLEVDLLNKVIDQANATYKTDLKKSS